MNNGARPTIWFRYVDDTFTLFHNKDTAVQFRCYLNSRYENIQFTIEFEQLFFQFHLPKESVHWSQQSLGFFQTSKVQN